MNDGPSMGARFARVHERLAAEDAERSEWLSRACLRRSTPEEREAERAKSLALRTDRAARCEQRLAMARFWPAWASPPEDAKPGMCAGCHQPAPRSQSGFCGKCGVRLGKRLRRAARTLRLTKQGPTIDPP